MFAREHSLKKRAKERKIQFWNTTFVSNLQGWYDATKIKYRLHYEMTVSLKD